MRDNILYVLDEQGEPQPCPDVLEWGRWMEANQRNRHIAEDYDEGDAEKRIRVSTVFLGTDMRHFGPGPPLLYETLVFGGPLDHEMRRYATRDEALRGHQDMCRAVIAANKEHP